MITLLAKTRHGVIYDFYFFDLRWSHCFIRLSATRLCEMTGYDLQLYLRYRNSIWNKETEIKCCSYTKMFLSYPWGLQVLTPRASPIFLAKINLQKMVSGVNNFVNFKDFSRSNKETSTFQGPKGIQGLFKTTTKIEYLFKSVRTMLTTN